MSFRVYFASNWKDSVNDPRIFPAQFGFGFTESGAPRLPQAVLPDALRILDDAILPKNVPEEAAFAHLARLCETGCLLDFERAPSQAHAAIVRRLAARLRGVPLFAAPERFLSLCPSLLPLVTPPAQCSNWRNFAAETGKRYPKGWLLELIPCKYSVQMPFPAQSSGILQDALCHYRQSGRTIRYYDTPETLSQKLALVQKNGCRAAIGLLQELQPFTELCETVFRP